MPTEFGRVPGKLNGVAGRHHYNLCYIGLFAGGGVKGGRIIGKTDATGEQCVETGWKYKMQPKTENIVASVYSALGIDWTKEITNTPSRRTYRFVDPLGATEPCIADEIEDRREVDGHAQPPIERSRTVTAASCTPKISRGNTPSARMSTSSGVHATHSTRMTSSSSAAAHFSVG